MAKIGILNIVDSSGTGGVFYYMLTLIEGLKNNDKHECIVFYQDPEFRKYCRDSRNCKLVFVPRCENKFLNITKKITVMLNIRFPFGKLSDIVNRSNLDLLIDPSASFDGFHFKFPRAIVVFDLMHRYYPGYPEYSMKTRAIRDIAYKKGVQHAAVTIADSCHTKEDLERFYKADGSKIRVIPYCPPRHIYNYKDLTLSSASEILKRYKIPERFIFYPAQFWQHKNHLRLIKALYLLREEHKIIVPVVFVGSQREDSKRTFPAAVSLIKRLNMEEQISFLGYVSEEEVAALYKKAVALVYPSLIGPTNVPPLEAMVLGTPVLCSNLFCVSEQIRDAGLLFDPFDVEDMAEKICRIWVDEGLRQGLIKKGYGRIKNVTPENYAERWNQVIEEVVCSAPRR